MPEAVLESYLAAQLDVESVETDRRHAGLNTMIAVSTPDTTDAYLLRSPTALRDTPGFNDLETEYRLLEHLADTPIPAPDPVLYCPAGAIPEAPCFLSTRLPGNTVPMRGQLPDRFQTATARQAYATAFLDTLATLHGLDTDRFADVATQRAAGDQVRAWRPHLETVADTTGRDLTELFAVADWLETHAPTDDPTALVHGDFRPGNLLVDGEDTPQITGVIDWETAFLGNPLTELGYVSLLWGPIDPRPALDPIVAQYRGHPGLEDVRFVHERGFQPFTTDEDTPGAATMREWYLDRTGFELPDHRYYQAHAALGLATVWETLHRDARDSEGESTWPPLLDYLARHARLLTDAATPPA
ncbi:MAG: phosphotransferase family protein [Halobacteriaceae archaeon]